MTRRGEDGIRSGLTRPKRLKGCPDLEEDMIRVLVVEDSPTVRQLLVSLLEADSEICVVGEATNGRQAVELASQLHPDLIDRSV